MYTIYMHTNKINNKKYVGITCQEPWTRRFNGNGYGYKSCVLFNKAINKYGWENFEHSVLDICENENDAKQLERYYINLYKSNNNEFGYNIMEGGQTQRYPQSIKDKISAANKGKPSPAKGKRLSEEQKQKIRDAQKGRPLTPEHAENCRKATREYYKTHSPAHVFTEEDHKAAREAWQIRIRVVETGQEFESMTECAAYFSVLISNLSRAIKHKKKYKGFHFEKVCS